MHRVRVLEYLSVNDISLSNHSPQGLGNTRQRLWKERRWRSPRKQGLLQQHNQNSYEFTEAEAVFTGPAYVYTTPFLPRVLEEKEEIDELVWEEE